MIARKLKKLKLNMCKYRIKSLTFKNEKTRYIIQERDLFWWKDKYVLCNGMHMKNMYVKPSYEKYRHLMSDNYEEIYNILKWLSMNERCVCLSNGENGKFLFGFMNDMDEDMCTYIYSGDFNKSCNMYNDYMTKRIKSSRYMENDIVKKDYMYL